MTVHCFLLSGGHHSVLDRSSGWAHLPGPQGRPERFCRTRPQPASTQRTYCLGRTAPQRLFLLLGLPLQQLFQRIWVAWKRELSRECEGELRRGSKACSWRIIWFLHFVRQRVGRQPRRSSVWGKVLTSLCVQKCHSLKGDTKLELL